MTDRRRAGRKSAKEEPQSDQMSKETEAIAKFVRFNCPTKMAMFEGNEVHYFSGRKAVDTLVESKKYGAGAKEPKFASAAQAQDFLSNLLTSGLFFRAKILVPKKKDDPRRSKREEVKESPRVRRAKQADEEEKAGESGYDSKKDEQAKKEDDEKKKKKFKVVVHDVQVFNNDTDVYVWVFDPTPLHKKIIGFLIVVGVILACLFPLWPDWLRLGVYYLSVTGISLFGVLLGVAFLRTVLFCAIYAASWGRHKLWILPNLTEDCGFFESFQPWYTYEYCASGESSNKKKKKKDVEEEPLVEEVEEKATPKPTNKSKKASKKEESSTPPPDPRVSKSQPHEEEINEDETDPEEKYSKPSSEDENSAAEEDEVTENDEAATGSTGDSSEPVDVKIDDLPKESKKVEDPQPSPAGDAKPRRRRVRRADDEDFVMVQSGEDQ